MKDALSFGDVFLHEERHYIFFLESNDVFYCGRILGEAEKAQLLTLYNRPSERIQHDHIAFCFVVLTTQTLAEKIAHLAKTDRDITRLPISLTYVCTLNARDRKAICDKIRDSSGIPVALKKYVETLEL